ncbi:MFS transporter [Actinoplanes cyaneus]|uniref:MFS transporter n=1 Tax=Actinoplanes cyaneus TaxID=52696 RepID=A0A919M4B9_9ACTN|nr:MFS transporter [Actinoplanes cyaneus]MCW2140123.1 putative arabinose efflux permease, MFS family [Actinoplanes cyaneus]GID65437.1 MFS transporter [Actinoplanes cyaneus]
MSFRRAQLSVAALFGSLGFQYSTWAARIPALTDRMHLSAAQVGVLLLAAGVGAVVSAPLVPKLMSTFGSRILAVSAVVVLVTVLACLAVVPLYPLALVVLLADGVAVGCLNVAMNAQGAALESTFERTTMAKLHATFSGGIFAGALLASAVTSVTGSVPAHFAVAGLILLGLTLAARPALLTSEPAPAEPAGRRWSLPTGAVLWLGLAMLLATITEGAMTDWSALYLKEITHAADHLLPLGIAVTSGMMLLARLFADGWRDRWGDRTVVVAGGTLAGAGLAAGLLAGGAYPALAGFACVGLGMAAVSPCLYMAAARHGTTALTAAATMSTTGLLLGPPAIGFAGLHWSMAVVVGTAWLTVLCALAMRWPARSPAPVG